MWCNGDLVWCGVMVVCGLWGGGGEWGGYDQLHTKEVNGSVSNDLEQRRREVFGEDGFESWAPEWTLDSNLKLVNIVNTT